MSTRPLLFDWPGRHHLQVVLPLAIGAAAVLHVAAFFLFAVVYPRPQADAIDPVTAYFPLPDSAAAGELAALLASSDPSLVAPGRLPPVRPNPTSTAYVPSFLRRGVDLTPLPARVEAEAKALPPGPVPVRLAPRPAPAAPRSFATRLVARGALAGRLPEIVGDALRAQSSSALLPAVFLVRVGADGGVLHVFRVAGSGNEMLDTAAATLLARAVFAPGGEGPVWDEVEVHWGSQTVSPAP